MKLFASTGEILLSERFWDLLWYVWNAMNPMHCLLRLLHMRIVGMDKVKYYTHQLIDRLLPEISHRGNGRVRAVQL